MNQKKTGDFLKQLRKEKNMTQEQLAEKFYVSGRTVSRWETGNNMPDLGMLVELADFYDVDIREIIDGERKSEIMNLETKDTLKKVAEYTAEENRKLRNKMADMMAGTAILVIFSAILFGTNAFNGAIPKSSYHNMMNFTLGLTLVTLVLNIMYLFGMFERIRERREAYLNRKKEK
ncbi:MAG: helix-turn-helix domain-containing protein [Lachnospiraceae bacterium]|nr:helix-turn-helix domain-containing protein [Lachnospiraceae bacterium]